MTLRQLSGFLTEEGFPIALSSLKKITASSRVEEGPPSEGFWGRLKLYDPDKALVWARGRLSETPASFDIDQCTNQEMRRN